MVDRVGHYNLLERIGAGGLGDVYRARDTKFGRTVAVKLPPAALTADRERRRRLLEDARAAARLSHPNIATLFEVGEDEGQVYLAFEFVPGSPLRVAVGERPMKTRTALDLAIQIADALSMAHSLSISHRDLHPDTIVVTPKGHAKILEFGLSAWTTSGVTRRKAAAGAGDSRHSTAAYMAPEQVQGAAGDERSDIFSFGVVAFEMFTGRHPFAPGGQAITPQAIVEQPASRATGVYPGIQPEIDPILERALAKNPEERYQSAASLAGELRSAATILTIRSGEAEPVNVLPPTPARRRRLAGAALGMLLLLLTGAIAYLGRDAAYGLYRRYVVPPPPPVLLVRPLDVSGSATVYLADALAEDVAARLGLTPGLQVIGRAAIRDDRARDAKGLAAEVGAPAWLRGTVGRQQDDLELHLELVDAGTETTFWTGRYARSMHEVLAVQAAIAGDVANALRVRVPPTSALARTASRSVDPAAYDLYARAGGAASLHGPAGAVELLRQAVTIDPGLAEAQAALAGALVSLSQTGRMGAPEVEPLVRRALQAALSTDPDLPAARVASSLATPILQDALRHLMRAVETDQTYAAAYQAIGDRLAGLDPERAIEFYQAARRLEPTDPELGLTFAYLQLARFDEAERELTAASARLGPIVDVLVPFARGDFAQTLVGVGRLANRTGGTDRLRATLGLVQIRALVGAGRLREARDLTAASLDEYPHRCEFRAMRAALLADTGQRAEGVRMARAMLEASAGDSASPDALACAALASAALGDAAATTRWLRRIAQNEAALANWVWRVAGFPRSEAFRRRWYPWSRVGRDQGLVETEKALERASRALRETAAQMLDGLPPSRLR